MGSSFEQMVFELIASDREASAAFDRFRGKVDQTSGSVDKNSAALDKNAKSLDKNAQSSKSALGALIGVGVAFAPITAGAAAAGIGLAAFGAMAVPSVRKITTAMTGPGGLSAAWGTLDNRQRVAVQGVQGLGSSYSALAKSMEPQVFQVFNSSLGLANSLLAPVGKLAAAAGTGIESFLVQFTAHSGIQQFIGFLSTIAGPSFSLLGTDITSLSHAVFSLLQSFGGAGLLELRALSDVFIALDTSITFLSQNAPGLTSVALGIGGIALALSKLGLLSGALKITGIASIAGDMTGFAAATRGATLAEKGMLATTTALDAITPWGWVALGAAALGGLVFWLSHAKSVTDGLVGTLNTQNHAVGFNTAGYLSAAAAIQEYNLKQQQQQVVVGVTRFSLGSGTVAVGTLTGATNRLNAAVAANIAAFVNQNDFLGILQKQYGLTRLQAISLAEKSGVLASQVDKGGRALKDSVTQAQAYANANVKAQQPTSQLAADMADYSNKTLTATARTKALTDALKLFFDPAVTADQDVITLKNDQLALSTALKASGGSTGLLTQKQRDARGAFDTYISQVAQTATDAFNATGKTSSYSKVIQNALPVLDAAAGRNKTLRQEIRKLIDTETGLKSENVAIHVSGSGSWNVVGPGGPGHHVGGAAAGTVVPGYGGGDRHLYLLEGGEAVISKERTRANAAALAAIGVPGLSAGGVTGSYGAGVPGLGKWLTSENTATISAIAAGTAAALVKAASATGGAGIPGPGGGAPAQNQALAMLMFGNVMRPGDWAAWNYVEMREAGWSQFARNPSSGAYGIPQALPPGKMGPAANPPQSNPAAQISWMWQYMRNVYGGPQGAAAHELAFNWYDHGGYLPPGVSIAANGTGHPERVGGGNTYHITVNMPFGSTKAEVADGLARALDDLHRAGRLP